MKWGEREIERKKENETTFALCEIVVLPRSLAVRANTTAAI